MSDETVAVCRTVFADTQWFLLEHGTIFVARPPRISDEVVITKLDRLAKTLGPYSGEGSEWGDCNPAKLAKFDGWLVTYPAVGYLVTYVSPAELETAPPPSETERFVAGDRVVGGSEMPFELRVAIFGRYKRNLDARHPKIVARSVDA